jgi:hypothetical protein
MHSKIRKLSVVCPVTLTVILINYHDEAIKLGNDKKRNNPDVYNDLLERHDENRVT